MTLQVRDLMSATNDFPFITTKDTFTLLGIKFRRNKRIISPCGENEKELQTWFTANVTLLNGLDTHSSIQDAIEFLPPRIFHENHVVYTNTGQPDLTSLRRRLLFEMNSKSKENELIIQILDRVQTSLTVSYMLKNSIAFGATPDMCFIVIGIRHLPIDRSDESYIALYVFKVNRQDIIPLWMALNAAEPWSFLTQDAPLICNGLTVSGINPWLCRVHLKDWSQSRVYDITLPAKFEWPRNIDFNSLDEETSRECVGVVNNAPNFAMKIIHESDSFTTEVEALFAVKPPYFISGISCEGIVTHGAHPLTTPSHSFPPISNDSNGGWWNRTPPPPSQGGCLLMDVGEPLPNQLNDPATQHDIFNQIYQSVSKMHNLNYCHTDIRLPNILKFGDKYCLIDYGEAVKEGAVVCIEGFSERRKQLVFESGPYVRWRSSHDIAMLARAVYQISPGHPLAAITTDTGRRREKDDLDNVNRMMHNIRIDEHEGEEEKVIQDKCEGGAEREHSPAVVVVAPKRQTRSGGVLVR
jgi:hypothetical protein